MNKVEGALADEGVTVKFSRKSVAAIDGDSRSAGKIARGAAAAFNRAGHDSGDAPARAYDAPGFFLAHAVNLGRAAVDGNTGQSWRHLIERITTGIAFIVHEQADVIVVVAREPAPVIIKAETVLPSAGFC